jgi:HrpA-like RNA helicase
VKAILGGCVAARLAAAITPPDPCAVAMALQKLRDLTALDTQLELTPLGQHLVRRLPKPIPSLALTCVPCARLPTAAYVSR